MHAVWRWTFAGRAWRSLGIAAVAAVAGLGALPVGLPTAVAAELPTECVQSGPQVDCTYRFTGGEQIFTVPAGITSVQVSAVGAAGAPSVGGAPGGKGAQVTGDLSGLGTGEPLYVEVGGTPTGSSSSRSCLPAAICVGGFNGGGSSYFGGGGGGASDVRRAQQAQGGSLDSRLIVAGGGGGGGYRGTSNCFDQGTPGGDAGTAGGTSSCPGVGTSIGGGPGTATAGGTGGTPLGAPGTLGTGGNGGGPAGSLTGGAGGGGLYGGGGGGNVRFSPAEDTAGGGGGGGSSLVPTGGTMSLSSAPASVTITYLLRQQTIAFPAVAEHVYGGPDFDPGATASSGFPVSYTSTTPQACSIVGGKVHILAAGTCTITASQDGDPNYAPAQQVSRDITINKAPIAITASARHGLLTTTFTVHVTSTVTGASVAGEPVTVNATNLLGNRFSCTATTNSSGTASCSITSLLGLKSHYTVSVRETANYLPATATE